MIVVAIVHQTARRTRAQIGYTNRRIIPTVLDIPLLCVKEFLNPPEALMCSWRRQQPIKRHIAVPIQLSLKVWAKMLGETTRSRINEPGISNQSIFHGQQHYKGGLAYIKEPQSKHQQRNLSRQANLGLRFSVDSPTLVVDGCLISFYSLEQSIRHESRF